MTAWSAIVYPNKPKKKMRRDTLDEDFYLSIIMIVHLQDSLGKTMIIK